MYLIDGPYVSDYLKRSLSELSIRVIQTPQAQKFLDTYPINFISERDAIEALNHDAHHQVYTNSENALDWIYDNFPSSELTSTIQKVKDKTLFRQHLKQIHPDYYFQESTHSELSSLPLESIPFPVILKPSIGFFSLGVQRIENAVEWHSALQNLDQIIRESEGIYPQRVLDNSRFIIEEVIIGDEFAIDCYFDAQGKVVILNMMKHLFASDADVNDRVYITSAAIMQQYVKVVSDYLNTLGQVLGLKRFQAHIELRIDGEGLVNAIEINPLRFGGWCSTPDLSQYAWNMNIYEMLVNQSQPDWSNTTHEQPDRVYALVVLNNSTGTPGNKIKGFDYKRLLKQVQNPLELRKTDYAKFPLFGFLMCSVPGDDLGELYDLLHSDLKEFVTL